MEEILINVDSRYRDIFIYQNECKFRYNFENTYKNIISARMISIEINNSASYLDFEKKNNFITVHLPDKINDPEGIRITLDEGLYQVISAIQNVFNVYLRELYNTNGGLQRTTVNEQIFAEKYFYFFYLNYAEELTFDFNSSTFPSSLSDKLILNKGWYSIYGLVKMISNYITNKYNDRKKYKLANPSTPTIDLDSGNFVLDTIILGIFDRRFRSSNSTYDCVRYDNIASYTAISGNLTTNLANLKKHIYTTYIDDDTLFIPQTTSTYALKLTHGILDQLNSGNYIVPNVPNYTLSGLALDSRSIYYLNIAYSEPPTYPTIDSTQIYNLLMQTDLTSLKVSFTNYFTKSYSTTDLAGNFAFYYYYSPYPDATGAAAQQAWNYSIDNVTQNLFDNLFASKQYLLNHKFITQSEFDDPFFEYSSEKDIPNFEIDFSTYLLTNHVSKGLVDIKKMAYPPVGYYLGFRPNLMKTVDQFIFKGTADGTERSITGSKIFDTTGDDYMFLKLNNWGYIDFFAQKMFAKILLTTSLGNPKIDDYVNKEFRFRQPIDITKLDVELVDYLGNTIQLGGFDWSFTLELKQLINSSEKTSTERNALVFNTIYRS